MLSKEIISHSKRTITIDARMINSSGIGVYLRKYISFILESNQYKVILIGNKTILNNIFVSNNLFGIIQFTASIYTISEQLILPFLIPRCDTFWSPHYNTPILPIRAKKRLLTIPDTAHITLAHQLKFGIIKRLYSKILIWIGPQLSSRVITISEFSKNEILRYSPVHQTKITTIHLGVDRDLFRPIEDKISLQQTSSKYKITDTRFILYVGNVKPHKNLITLIHSLINLTNQFPDLILVIVGKKDGFITGDPELFKLIDQTSSIKYKVKFTGFVEERELPILYSLAQALVFPSLYEGFGLPPLEAMSVGCPVVASNKASIPEVCKDAAYYFDPENTNMLTNAVTAVLNNQEIRNKLIEKGYETAYYYNWEESCADFLDVLKSLNS